MNSEQAYNELTALMKQHEDFGARDSEGYQALDRVFDAVAEGKPFPLRSQNPFQLYQSEPGWQLASVELVNAAQRYWELAVKERLGLE